MGCEATLGCNFSIPRLLVPKDWGGIQGGRLRAMMALCIRMTKRTTSARRGVASAKKLATDSVARIVLSRSEEMQAIKNFIASLPAFQASRCLKLCHPANVQPVPSGTPSCKRAQGYGTRWRSSACHLSQSYCPSRTAPISSPEVPGFTVDSIDEAAGEDAEPEVRSNLG